MDSVIRVGALLGMVVVAGVLLVRRPRHPVTVILPVMGAADLGSLLLPGVVGDLTWALRVPMLGPLLVAFPDGPRGPRWRRVFVYLIGAIVAADLLTFVPGPVAFAVSAFLAVSVVPIAAAAVVSLARLWWRSTGDRRARIGLVLAAGGVLVVIRGIIDDLRPDDLVEQGLVATLRSRAADFDRPGEFRVLVEVGSDLPPLAPSVQVAVLRVANEAICNAARHSGGSRCVVRLPRTRPSPEGAAEVWLTVADDGHGLPGVRRAGVGLESMELRTRAAGGSLAIGPGTGGGTLVDARPGRGPALRSAIGTTVGSPALARSATTSRSRLSEAGRNEDALAPQCPSPHHPCVPGPPFHGPAMRLVGQSP